MSTAPARRRSGETRTRILDAAVALLAERGTTGTGLNQLVESSGVSYGSVYHQFRGGKDELISGAVEWAGTTIGKALEAVFDGSASLADATATMFAYGSAMLTGSDFVSGCPVGTAIGDGHRSDSVRAAAAGSFAAWRDSIERAAIGFGADDDEAHRFASVALSLYEGALLVARAQRSTAPLEHASRAAVGIAERIAP